MRKIDFGQTVSALANLGVIAGIVFLALELRQNNELLEMESRLARTEAYVNRTGLTAEEYRQLALSTELADLLTRARNEGVNALSESERLRVTGWELARMYRVAGQYYQYEQGYLSEEAINDVMRLAAVPNLQLWRELGIEVDNDSFRAALEEMAAQLSR